MKTKEKERKLQVRDAYCEFVERHFQQSLAKLNDKQRTEGLTRFYIEEIHNRVPRKGKNLPWASSRIRSTFKGPTVFNQRYFNTLGLTK